MVAGYTYMLRDNLVMFLLLFSGGFLCLYVNAKT